MANGQHIAEVKATIRAEVRPCREEDLRALEWMGLFGRDRQIIEGAFEQQQRGGGVMLIADAGGFPIAKVWIDFERHPSEEVAVLWAIRTFHPLRRAGIGPQMMAAAEKVLRRRGVRVAELEVDHGNEKACRFYRRLVWTRKRDARGRPVETPVRTVMTKSIAA